MKNKIFYRITGKKGRITLPHTFRINLEITDDTVLRYTSDGKSVIVTPMIVVDNMMTEREYEFNLSEEDAVKLLNNCSENSLKLILSAVLKKLNLSAEDGVG